METLKWDNIIYREAGLPEIVLRQSPVIENILESRINRFTGTLNRLTGTMAVNGENLFERTLNTAFNKTISGTHSYVEALNEGMDEMAREGIKSFHYVSGRNISIEAAILMNIRTSINQAAAAVTEQGMTERGVSYVDTTAHKGARNKGECHKNHEQWQGKQYYFKEIAITQNTANLPDFTDETGYKLVDGMCGANCRHSFTSFFPGISTPLHSREEIKQINDATVTYKDPDTGEEKKIPVADAQEYLRYLERGLRNWKRREQLREAANLGITLEKRKIKEWSGRIAKFTQAAGIRRVYHRERIAKK